MMAEKISLNAGTQKPLRFYADVLLRALLLLVIVNILFAFFKPVPKLARLSAYNSLFPGRLRLPYGENPERDYNTSLSSLEAMFAAHEISANPKSTAEYRVVFIGDSSTWGFLLEPDQTLSAYINQSAVEMPDGRYLRAYNLGYPVMSLAKDLLILNEAMAYQPDLIVWPVTLESFPGDKQLTHPLLQQNPERVSLLNEKYSLGLDTQAPGLEKDSIWDETIFGARRELADLLRLQLYGVLWSATGIDHEIPENYSTRQEDLADDISFHNISGPPLEAEDLSTDLLAGGHRIAGRVPILLVNEPMFISQGKNSHIRYNFFYPRWIYDDYRTLLSALSKENSWHYLDLWEAVDAAQFTNSAVHMTPEGTRQLAQQLIEGIIEVAGTDSK